MGVYLVRNRTTKGIMGIFWGVSNLLDLWWGVDAYTDPSDYEYTSLKVGELVFKETEPVPQQLSELAEDDEDGPKDFPWEGACAERELWDRLYNAQSAKWKPFPYADQPGGGAFEAVKEAKSKGRGVYASKAAP